jgi:hypothetical protein
VPPLRPLDAGPSFLDLNSQSLYCDSRWTKWCSPPLCYTHLARWVALSSCSISSNPGSKVGASSLTRHLFGHTVNIGLYAYTCNLRRPASSHSLVSAVFISRPFYLSVLVSRLAPFPITSLLSENSSSKYCTLMTASTLPERNMWQSSIIFGLVSLV